MMLALILVGLATSVVAGRALAAALDRIPEERRHRIEWTVILAAALIAAGGSVVVQGVWGVRIFAFVLATLPGLVAYLAWRTALASAVISLLPVYFAIADLVRDRPLHAPYTALDRVMTLQPAWMLVYGSMYVFVLLPLLVVREPALFRQALKAYITVLVLAYVGFLAYPTISPRPAEVVAAGFGAWCLRLNYALDLRYNCFPSLHVAHSFVSALSAYRVHRGVGIAAVAWAALVGVSTVFTKQHYVVDAIAGALMGFLAYALFLRTFPRDRVPDRDRRRAPRRALLVVVIYCIFIAGIWLLSVANP
jgi:membrane-associated phospholipid phosphatase